MLRRLLGIALLAAGLLLGPAAPPASPRVRAQGGGTVRIRPAALTIGAGGSGTVEVWLEGAAGYYGLELRLAWDPAVAAAAEAQVVPLWEVFDPGSHMLLKNRAGWCDDGSGRRWHGAWYAVANVSPAPVFSGSGRVCAIRLTGLAPGITALVVSAEGATNAGARLSPATAGATIVVVPATATPTATCPATPSITPTRTATPVAAATPFPNRPATPTSAPSPVPAQAGATPVRVTATPRWLATPGRASVTPRSTHTGTPSPTATMEEAAEADPVSQPGLLGLLLPFLLGMVLTAGMLRVARRRRR